MIIQCDHCSARFKMDDSKLANGPVKVRCAKCKEVFVVRPEEPVATVVAPPLPEPAPADRTDPSEFSFDTPSDSNNSATQAAADFSFDIETPAVSAKAASGQSDAANEFDWQTASKPDSDDSEAESRFDLSSFDASLDAPHQAAVAASAPVEDNDFDFGEVDFSTTNAPTEESSVVAGSDDSDDFSMDFGVQGELRMLTALFQMSRLQQKSLQPLMISSFHLMLIRSKKYLLRHLRRNLRKVSTSPGSVSQIRLTLLTRKAVPLEWVFLVRGKMTLLPPDFLKRI